MPGVIPAVFIMSYISLEVQESICFDLSEIWDEIGNDDFVKEMEKRGLRQNEDEKPTDPKDQIRKIICDANGLNYHIDNATLFEHIKKLF